MTGEGGLQRRLTSVKDAPGLLSQEVSLIQQSILSVCHIPGSVPVSVLLEMDKETDIPALVGLVFQWGDMRNKISRLSCC